MIKKLLIISIAGLFVTAPSAALARSGAWLKSTAVSLAAQSPEQQIRIVYHHWLAALSTGGPEQVTKLYTEHAVLLPTFSDNIADTRALRYAYFKGLTAKENLKGEPKVSLIRVFGDIAVNSGYYDFSYTEHKAIKIVHARFSFVYHKIGGTWLIIDHHSSEMPKAH